MPRTDWSRNVDLLNRVLAAATTGSEPLVDVARRVGLSPSVVAGLKRQYGPAYLATGPLSVPLPSTGSRPSNWLQDEDDLIRVMWPHRDRHGALFGALAGRTRRAVVNRASQLGVKLVRQRRAAAVRLRRIGASWSEQEDATLIRMYENGSLPSEIALALSPRTVSAVRQAIHRLGLVRSAASISKIRSDARRRCAPAREVKLTEIEVPAMRLGEAKQVLPLGPGWAVFFVAKQKVSSGDRLRIAAARALVQAGVARTRSRRSDSGALRYMICATGATEASHG